MDSTSVADARGNKYLTEKLKNLRNAIQTMPDAKGSVSLFPKNGGRWGIRAAKLSLFEYRKVGNRVVYFDKRNYFGIALINKVFCVRQGIST